VGDALSKHYYSRESRESLGRWIRATYGPSLLVASSVDLSPEVVYYARCKQYHIPAGADEAELIDFLNAVQPDLVLVTSGADRQRFRRALEQHPDLQFVRVAPESLPRGWQHATLLARSRTTSKLAQTASGTDGTK
jgi:hypothetical protein